MKQATSSTELHMNNWISVSDQLPKHNQAVLVRRSQDNWIRRHLLDDGSENTIWRWQACKFVRGRSAQEVETSGTFSPEDEQGNNKRPYHWKEFGPGQIFGQDVSHWMPIYDVCVREERDYSKHCHRQKAGGGAMVIQNVAIGGPIPTPNEQKLRKEGMTNDD